MPPLLARLRTAGYRLTTRARVQLYRKLWKMDIGDHVRLNSSVRLDKTNPRGIHIGEGTLVSFDTAILSHDFVRAKHVDTWIGRNCFIGAKVIVMPGVRIGHHCIIGSGAVVTSDIPDRSIAVGNPARVIRSEIETVRWGILREAFADEAALARDAANLRSTRTG